MDKLNQEQENELIKSYFKDNTDLLLSIRSLFFGLPVTESDKGLIKQIFEDEKFRVVFRKNFYSKFGDTVGIEKIGDFWAGLDINNIIGSSSIEIEQVIKSRQLALDMLEKAMKLLENPEGDKVNLEFNIDSLDEDPFAIKFLARSKFMATIASGLNIVNILANTKAKTQNEVLDAMKKNSSK